MDPLSGFAAGVNCSIKILEVCYSLQAVGEQTKILLRTTEHVNRNISEAHRLRSLKASCISVEERAWMDATIHDTEQAMLEVAQLIEPARVDSAAMCSISPKNRVLWVFRDSPKVKDKHSRLSMCHQTLVAVISVLYAKNVVDVASPPAEKSEDQPPPYSSEMEAIFNWRSQKRRRKILTHVKARTNPTSQSSTPEFSNPLFPSPDEERAISYLAHTYSDMPSPRPGKFCNEDRLTPATPPPFYSSFEGADGLQVQDFRSRTDLEPPFCQATPTADQFPPSVEFWSPVALLPCGSFSPGTSSNHDKATHQQSILVSLPASQSSEKGCDIAKSVQFPNGLELADHAPAERSTPGFGRASSRSRGRQWLVHYASQSERGPGMGRW